MAPMSAHAHYCNRKLMYRQQGLVSQNKFYVQGHPIERRVNSIVAHVSMGCPRSST